MIRKTTLNFTKHFLLFGIFLLTGFISHAQSLAPSNLTFDKICAGKFNEFNATFSYVDFPAGTTFSIEISDNAGSFANPIATTTLQVTDISATQQSIKFAIPSTLIGYDTYSLRVKSNPGTVVSGKFNNVFGKSSFPIFYKDYEAAFFINNKNQDATICSGGSLTLSVYNETPSDLASSPANYPNLKYIWYRDDVVIAGESKKSIVVNSVGQYYAVIDYGLCTDSNFSSNRVSVVSSNSGSAVTVSSSLGNPFCSSGAGTVLTASSGNKYQWFKDGNKIEGATNRSYSTNESGQYSVNVDFGGCSATGSLDLKSNSFNAALDVPDNNLIGEGETLNVSVTTDAVSPTYEWFFNDALIAGATSNSYLVHVKGNYKVKISQSSGCVATKELAFKVTSSSSSTATVIPNIISLSSYPYWDLPSEYQNPNTKVIILSSQGEIVFQGVDYDSSKWVIKDFKNANPVYYYVIQSDTGEKKGSITVIK